MARYLIKTKDLRIVYGTHDTHGLVLYGFSDSDWGADPDSSRSTGAYIFFLDGAACSWKVKLSSTALLSSQESEYVAGSEATKEALNLRMLLEHLGFGDPRPTDIYVDNKGAITMGLPIHQNWNECEDCFGTLEKVFILLECLMVARENRRRCLFIMMLLPVYVTVAVYTCTQ